MARAIGPPGFNGSQGATGAPGPKGDLKNDSFLPQVNNVNKMTGPIGPPGFNGSRGPPGPAGSIGPKGAGDFSACQYKMVTETETPGDPSVIAGMAEPNVSMLNSNDAKFM